MIRQKEKRKSVLLIVIVSVLILILVFDISIKPILNQISDSISKNIVSEIISENVIQVMKDTNIAEKGLMTFNTSEDGVMTSAVCNSALLNAFSADILSEISNDLKSITSKKYKVSIGTMTNITALNGRGPKATFRLSHIGYPEITYVSEFESAGINQTKHRIIMNIKIKVNTVIFPYTDENEYSFDYIVSEAIIIGSVPDSFTEITGDSRDVISKINDY